MKKLILLIISCLAYLHGSGIENTSNNFGTFPDYGNYNPVLFTPPPPVCNTPTGITTLYVGATNAIVSWDYDSLAFRYEVRYKDTAAINWITVYTSTNKRNLIGLSLGTHYEYQVRTYCGYGNYSGWSVADTFTTSTSMCYKPFPYTTNITYTSAFIIWKPVLNATGYELRYKDTASVTWASFTTTQNQQLLSGLANATPYHYQVRTICSNTYSDWSCLKFFKTLDSNVVNTCKTPTGLATTYVGVINAIVSWDYDSLAFRYEVRYKDTAATNWITVYTSKSQKNLFGLAPATHYEYQVRTYCGYGNYSGWSVTDTFTTLTSMCYKTHPYAINITYNSALIFWKPVFNATGYELRYKDTSSVAWASLTTTQNQQLLSGLANATPYHYQVRTICNNAYSDWSRLNFFTTLDTNVVIPVCNTPTGLTAIRVYHRGALVKWNPDSMARHYQVRYKDTTAISWKIVNSPYYVRHIWGLIPATHYEYQVRAYCGYGSYSTWSAVDTFTTKAFWFISHPVPIANTQTQNALLKDDQVFDQPSSMDEKDTQSELTIYPNPSNGTINIESQISYQFVQIMNMTGKVLFELPSDENNRYNLPDIDNGIYLLRLIENNNIVKAGKILIIN